MFREPIEKMAPYTPGEQPRPGQRLVKLNTNENPYPPSPRVRRAVIKAASAAMRLYPPPRADEFVASAARLYGFPTRMILAGNGSDELLSMLFRAALGPGLTIVCNPNSPCGTLAPPRELEKLARALDGRLLAIDEAYVDFADSNALHLVKRHPNVVVLRSLSKSFSLAGMRLGLCFAQPPVIEALLKVKDSYNLNRAAIAAGARALEDAAWMRRNVERVKRTRALTEVRLRKMGFEVPPSSANFVLARFEGHDMGPVAAALRRRGILVRHFPTSVFRDAMRISIGTPAEMAALFKALEPLVKPYVAARGNGRVRNPV